MKKLGHNDHQPVALARGPSKTYYLSAEDVVVNASDDLKIPISSCENIKISWDVNVHAAGEVGFAVLKAKANSSMDFLCEYVRADRNVGEMWLSNKSGTSTTWYIFLDNSFSWWRQKQLSYSITVEEFAGTDDGGDGDVADEDRTLTTMQLYKDSIAFLVRVQNRNA